MITMNTPPPEWSEPRAPTDEEMTETWVEERLLELGFNERQAVALIRARADWHEARRLLERGCDRLYVVDILT